MGLIFKLKYPLHIVANPCEPHTKYDTTIWNTYHHHAVTGIQLFGSGAKFVPLSFYYLRCIALDIYLLQKVKNHKTI